MNSNTRILIVDDEKDIIDLIKYNLGKEGYLTDSAMDGNAAKTKLESERYDLVLLDLMLPLVNGMEICKFIKSKKELASIPIIMVSAKDDEIDRILGLEIGADDYITKPFSVRELVSRIKAVLRRAPKSMTEPRKPEETIKVLDLVIDEARFQVRKNGRDVELTAKEFKLLMQLIRNPGMVFSRDYLLDTVWGEKLYIEHRTMDVHIRRLREKIETDPALPRLILTKRGVGYYFSDDIQE